MAPREAEAEPGQPTGTIRGSHAGYGGSESGTMSSCSYCSCVMLLVPESRGSRIGRFAGGAYGSESGTSNGDDGVCMAGMRKRTVSHV